MAAMLRLHSSRTALPKLFTELLSTPFRALRAPCEGLRGAHLPQQRLRLVEAPALARDGRERLQRVHRVRVEVVQVLLQRLQQLGVVLLCLGNGNGLRSIGARILLSAKRGVCNATFSQATQLAGCGDPR